ncbi:glucose-1-phosphate thymidylyltransferase [Plantactinospora sp. KBS50]|uniref:glucose-1-phosphate thymidylyltransferase n=1 Tax=Plantactinospora sp. KBS50 TaxID=2024580 RepID=UPI000BAAC79A|nr:glucose-1-phosphate thymidylyltransferase [Plantactinospora sp. KBS50]ASW54600.1 glucose-1-phosphate thymidylyltransferase [Plantactinospora sp. KBS50]
MKALVLAGGLGSRLRPFSYSMPKQLVPVANRPVLLHCLDRLREVGITDVAIVVSSERGQAIRDAVGDGSQHGLRLTYLSQEAPLGLAHCVQLAADFLGDDDFLMYLGDNIFASGLGELAETFRRDRPAVQLVVTKVPDPSEYGVAEVDPDGRVDRLVEKPKNPTSDLAVIGVYFFTAAIHEATRRIQPSARGELEITDAIQWLVAGGADVRAAIYTGYWRDTGRIDDMLECNRVLLESTEHRLLGEVDAASEVCGPVAIEPGARVVRSRIVGPAVVGADSVVVDSYIGPYTALGRGCVLAGAGIEYSIVLDRVSVRDVRGIHGSLIGRSAEVCLSDGDLARHRLVIGDDTRVEVVA